MSTGAKVAVALGALVLIVGGFVGWQGIRALVAWNSVERVEFDLGSARRSLPSTTAGVTSTSSTTTTVPPVGYESVLVIGSDERAVPVADRDPDVVFADAILLYLLPDDGAAPMLVSIPRDLAVVDPCTGAPTKLDRTLMGCGDISGTELVALAVEDFTGIDIDHFAEVRFEALVEVVDAVGGVELCTEYPQREGGVDLLPGGCSRVDGEHALAWIRSRRTRELVDGEWRFVANVGDAARVEREQELLFALLDELKAIRTPTALAGILEDLGDSIVLSDTLGIGDAIGLAWDLRSMPSSQIRTATVPTEPTILPDGSFALLATVPFSSLLEP